MNAEQWDKLREERPDLQLYPYSRVEEASADSGILEGYTPEKLVTEITEQLLLGNTLHWARDPFWGMPYWDVR